MNKTLYFFYLFTWLSGMAGVWDLLWPLVIFLLLLLLQRRPAGAFCHACPVTLPVWRWDDSLPGIPKSELRGLLLSGIQIGQLAFHETFFVEWISTFLTGHMQHSPFLHAEKRTVHNEPQKWMNPRGAWPCGIHMRPFKVHGTYFCKMNFPIPACREWAVDPKIERDEGYMTHSYWTAWSPQNIFLLNGFPLFNRPHAAFTFTYIQIVEQ